jgi:rod shape determining protein RodA
MFDHRYLKYLDFKQIFIILIFMIFSLLVISSMTGDAQGSVFLTGYVKNQIQWFVLGWVVYLFFAAFDYRKFYDWTWIMYFLMVVLLIGLYFAPSIQRVHRWYRLPLIGMNIQPSEHAKLIIVFTLGWFLEKYKNEINGFSGIFYLFLIVAIPFLLILKQPDLGTALVLFPITLAMCYFGDVNQRLIKIFSWIVLVGLVFVALIFSGILDHSKMKPFFTIFLKEYQYERFNSNTYQQNACQTSIAIGGLFGSGWKKSEFASQKWLPAAHTDCAFASFGEEFGIVFLIFLIFLYYLLIHFCFHIVSSSNDYYARLLASGIGVYLAMHIIINIAMMIGFLPISGVPLILISYGGNSILTTMAALGILQSIYTRRFRF